MNAIRTEDTSTNSASSEIEVKGTPLSAEQLSDFVLDYTWGESCAQADGAGAFLDTLNDPQLKTAYCKALTLVSLLSTENIQPSGSVDYKNRAFLSVGGGESVIPITYMESGYTYDSFIGAYKEVFTDSLLNAMLMRGNVFYSYNGELWYAGFSAGGNPGEIHREYELINRSDNEVVFRRTVFSVDIGEPLTDYNPELRDSYITDSVQFRFILTDDGWRADEFLNQQNSEGDVYFF